MNIFRKISEDFSNLPIKNESLNFPFLITIDAVLICFILSLFIGFQIYMCLAVPIVWILSLAVYFLTDKDFCNKLAEISGWIAPFLFAVFIVLLVFICG